MHTHTHTQNGGREWEGKNVVHLLRNQLTLRAPEKAALGPLFISPLSFSKEPKKEEKHCLVASAALYPLSETVPRG